MDRMARLIYETIYHRGRYDAAGKYESGSKNNPVIFPTDNSYVNDSALTKKHGSELVLRTCNMIPLIMLGIYNETIIDLWKRKKK
jgi:hypothetical protein